MLDEQLSIPVDEDLLGGCLGGRLDGVRVGSFDELAGLEAGRGPDQGDEVGCVHGAPAGLRGLDELERHRQPRRPRAVALRPALAARGVPGSIDELGGWSPPTRTVPLVSTVLGFVFGARGRDAANQRADQLAVRADTATSAAVTIAKKHGELDELFDTHPDLMRGALAPQYTALAGSTHPQVNPRAVPRAL